MRLGRRRAVTSTDRAVWQAASLLLTYPDEGHSARLQVVTQLLDHVPGCARDLLVRAHTALISRGSRQAAEDYVETFDLNRHATLYLTYWTAGDTRRRGAAMHEFAAVYRTSGADAPKKESPDHLPVLLEFAARVDPEAGLRLLTEHRVPLDVVRAALTERGSPYGDVLAAVCSTLPAAGDQDVQLARRLAAAGPPVEAVGLEPFTLTVPPRRTEKVP
ncbi:nitrate reductase molybdenum cofactor assembly chaperone [Mycolicibacterium confluentis]|uniref:Nitrate reductase molybdenum cofactor assembly chaperone n=1 Tax=Mycolicibacterium confluentis TaxID=28047 RepID=A0A7I7XSS5_9MYCO|nr:nitrate reductase molybdenum cofactor assembly chaperone [Mycolicibacterium confluentis]MCV7321269.1 nitrate reductase molybdenum cofactor assembly chaperone [Mycolicibacterium confluentis]ORV25327.1 nitrate reductase [Mycolicibacterium confluentis]BBZ32251.1 nitrate reductase molybdenum cofactor assembly chaperone [Mycolicibacterium confluentis]